MSLRKNAKWNLVDIPDKVYLLPDLPCRQRARRKRFCNFCSTPILQGEEHLAIWRPTNQFFPIRYNICCLCARKQLEEKLVDVTEIYTYLKKQLKAVDKYNITNDLDTKRRVHHNI